MKNTTRTLVLAAPLASVALLFGAGTAQAADSIAVPPIVEPIPDLPIAVIPDEPVDPTPFDPELPFESDDEPVDPTPPFDPDLPLASDDEPVDPTPPFDPDLPLANDETPGDGGDDEGDDIPVPDRIDAGSESTSDDALSAVVWTVAGGALVTAAGLAAARRTRRA